MWSTLEEEACIESLLTQDRGEETAVNIPLMLWDGKGVMRGFSRLFRSPRVSLGHVPLPKEWLVCGHRPMRYRHHPAVPHSVPVSANFDQLCFNPTGLYFTTPVSHFRVRASVRVPSHTDQTTSKWKPPNEKRVEDRGGIRITEEIERIFRKHQGSGTSPDTPI